MQEAIHHQAHSNQREEGSEAVMNTASAAAPTLMRNQQAAHIQFSGMNHTIAGQNTQAAIHVWVNWNNGTASNTHIVQLPALLPGSRCYTDASTVPDQDSVLSVESWTGNLYYQYRNASTSKHLHQACSYKLCLGGHGRGSCPGACCYCHRKTADTQHHLPIRQPGTCQLLQFR